MMKAIYFSLSMTIFVLPKCQSSEGCPKKATHWILIEYSWPMLPNEQRAYLLCNNHLLYAQRSASNQMDKFPETRIRIIEHGALAVETDEEEEA
jgi:hypothetical protein